MIPRIVIAGTSSGAGKTTVASGLIGALRATGLTVQPFKVGPDYIDPSYHTLAAGRPGRNLDAFLSGSELIMPLLRHGSHGADIAVIEGVMGLFDGASGRGELASTAQIAKLTRSPVILVVDGSATSRSVAAVIHGFRSFDPELELAGVIFNRVGSEGHAQLLREAAELVPGPPLPVLGAIHRDERITAPERHLGLTPVAEREPRARVALSTLAQAVAAQLDLAAVTAIARAAPDLPGAAWSPQSPTAPTPCRIAVASGPAFSFHYRENLELLEAAGAELAPFDPIGDITLPDGSGGLLLAGGFPEVYGAELAANTQMREAIAAFAATGRPVAAECGGLLYLGQELDGLPMCGVLPTRALMGHRLTLGYREARAATTTAWIAAGNELRGHEFHYSSITPSSAPNHAPGRPGSGVNVESPPDSVVYRQQPAWELTARGFTKPDGIVSGNVQAGYLHVHWAAFPQIPRAFVKAAAA